MITYKRSAQRAKESSKEKKFYMNKDWGQSPKLKEKRKLRSASVTNEEKNDHRRSKAANQSDSCNLTLFSLPYQIHLTLSPVTTLKRLCDLNLRAFCGKWIDNLAKSREDLITIGWWAHWTRSWEWVTLLSYQMSEYQKFSSHDFISDWCYCWTLHSHY